MRWIRSRRVHRWAIAILLTTTVLPWGTWRILDRAFPFPMDSLQGPAASVDVRARDGRPLMSFADDEGEWHFPVPLSEVSPRFLQAIIATEDHRFYEHGGVDACAIARAALSDLWAMRVVSGASTITMQVVRLSSPRPRTAWGKCVEAFRAWQLEERLPKDSILEWYVNHAPFGGNLVGVEAAARRYFCKHAKDLTIEEATLLAGIPQSPARLRPDRHPERARARREVVLERMVACGKVTRVDAEHVRGESTNVHVGARLLRAPHACLEALARSPGGRDVRTTIDVDAQDAAERALAWQVQQVGVAGGAAVVVENGSNSVRALVGSPDFLAANRSGEVDASQARRSPGSALKPFLYAMAFEQGLTAPEWILDDRPLLHPTYHPENYDRSFRGPVTAREALSSSLNLPAIRLLERIGVDRFLSRLRACGIRSLDASADRYGLTLALGGGEVTLLDLVEAYATLARLGEHRPLRLLESDPDAPGERVFSEACSYLVIDVLKDPRAIEAQGIVVPESAPCFAMKTGTSNGHRDAWAVIFGPRFTVGVWIGNPDGSPSTALKGASAAAPAALRLYRTVAGTGGWYAQPSGVAEREVCAESGKAAIPGVCLRTRSALVSIAETGTERCDLHERRPQRKTVRIVSPVEGTRYLLTEDGATVCLRAEACEATRSLHWFVDGDCVGESPASSERPQSFGRGRHRITCVGEDGLGDSVTIEVE